MVTRGKRRGFYTHGIAVFDLGPFAEYWPPIHRSVAGSQVGIPVTGVVRQVKGSHVRRHYIEKIVGPFRSSGHQSMTGIKAKSQVRPA